MMRPTPSPLVRTLWLVALVGTAFVTPAGGQDLAPKGPWRVERSRVGDTTVVRTIAGSVWGGVARLTEELRIGTLDGEPEYMLGRPSCVLPMRGGSVALFDASVPAIRIYDSTGRHVRSLGRRGAGPGEFQDACSGMLADTAGVLSMYDPRNARINRYAWDGAVLPSIRSPGRTMSQQDLIADPSGRLFVKVVLRNRTLDQEGRYAFVRVLPQAGRPDTLHFPELHGWENESARFGPRKVVTWSPLGYFVAGFSDRYAISLFRRPGDVLRIEREAPRARVSAREKAEVMARAEEAYRTDKHHPPPEVVDPKAPYWMLRVATDGRIWVLVHTASRWGALPSMFAMPGIPPRNGWIEDPAYDVFEPDGRYLGHVVLPPKTWFAAAEGDRLWAIQLGSMDEPYIVRYRLSSP